MCFARQRRALFRHLNLQKWSNHGVFCTCWLRNVLRATTACTFSTSQVPKVRTWCALCILTWKCASRHNGVQFFISHLASWLRTRRFSEPTFRPSGATNHWKNIEKHSVSRLAYLFAHLHLLSSDSFSSLIFSLLIFLFSLPLPCSAFHLSILSDVWLLNFLRLCIQRKVALRRNWMGSRFYKAIKRNITQYQLQKLQRTQQSNAIAVLRPGGEFLGAIETILDLSWICLWMLLSASPLQAKNLTNCCKVHRKHQFPLAMLLYIYNMPYIYIYMYVCIYIYIATTLQPLGKLS